MTGDRDKVRKLKLAVEGEVRGRVGRVGRARVAQVVRDALLLEAHPPAGADLWAERSDRPLAVVLSYGSRLKFACAPVSEKCVLSARLSLEVMPCSASRVQKIFKKKNNFSQRFTGPDGSAQACRVLSKSREYRPEAVGTRRRTRRNSIFFTKSYRSDGSRRGAAAACGQRVTTYKISSRRDGLKSEETTDGR